MSDISLLSMPRKKKDENYLDALSYSNGSFKEKGAYSMLQNCIFGLFGYNECLNCIFCNLMVMFAFLSQPFVVSV